ncbi:MAG: C40 family peptidase [Rhodanobacter sp.]
MPINRLTAFSVLAAVLLVAVPVQATTSKTQSKPAHAQPQHKQANSKPAHHKPTHGKLASSAHKTSHTHSAASHAAVADSDLPTTVDTAETVEVKSALPTSHLLQAHTFAVAGATVSANAAPAWLNQAPVFNPAQMLVQSTRPTYFGALTAGDRSVAAVDAVAGDKSGQTPDAVGNENVTDLRKALITMAMNLRDIRYVRGGRDPSTGFDCSGFVRYVFAHAIGLQLPTNSASQFLAGLKVNRADMKPGDLVFFRTHGKRSISHVGIYISEGRFIHSPSAGKSVEISSLSDAYWAKRFAGAKRPEGIVQVAHNG